MEISLQKRLEQHFKTPKYQPQTKSEIARALRVSPEERAGLRRALQEMEQAGKIFSGAHGRYRWQRDQRGTLKGTVFIRLGGGGTLLVDFTDPATATMAATLGLEAGAARISIDAGDLGTAMQGDTVLAQVRKDEPQAWWRHVAEKRKALEQMKDTGATPLLAKVTKVLARKHKTLVGVLRRKEKSVWVVPDDALLAAKVEIRPAPDADCKVGDKVVVEITDWPTHDRGPRGQVLKRIGKVGDPGVDMLGIIYKYHLPQEFPPAVLAEAERVPEKIDAAAIADREDWRQREVITIDPADARDFDDAIAVTHLPNGGWELAVHIADVSHYVTPKSALDLEAKERGNSIYLADRVIPMLPERLSNGVCSLRPNEDRLTRAAILTYDAKGNRTASRFIRAVICSRQRYSYEQAYEVMEPYLKKPESALRDPAAPLPARAWALASLLRKHRFAAGSLDLDYLEIKVMLDLDGNPLGLKKIEHDESHQLIEEFMLQANEAVAEQLRAAGRPAVYRIHEDPNPDKLVDLREFLMTNGIHTGDLSNRRELQKALEIINSRDESAVLKLAVLKSMKRASYGTEPLGHYGLAKDNYLHFTSPIRRYADLLVHRSQANLLWGAKYAVPDYAKLGELSEHLAITERNAAEAETQSKRIKEMAYFTQLISAKKPPKFQAAISSVRRIGLFIELSEVMTRGIVRHEDLGPHHFEFDAKKEQYVCAKPKRTLKVGDIIDVVPIAVEHDRGSVAFRLI